ncbi:MAG: VWA domain-containing protein [Clostridia bacterium]|nr:VWA domain-containing protein [Clostridia bacterium]
MKLLAPLGLLGLLSIIVLIIIYIIKPNYQQKFISSTFVWKLSLKYRKKKIPTSRLRNFLIILCQILILTSCALILAQPNKILKAEISEKEVVIIVDSSASMRTETNGELRFERAVDSALEFANSVLDENGIVSVILADTKGSVLVSRVRADNRIAVADALEPLLDGDTACSYGSADIEGAVALCEDIVLENPDAEIYVYTDTTYSYLPEGITVVNDFCDNEEWNAAILDAYAVLDEGYYSFVIDVACYNRDMQIAVEMEVHGANAYDSNESGLTVPFVEYVECNRDETVRIVFINSDLYNPEADMQENVVYHLIEDADEIFSYQSVHISINEQDSFAEDNSFNIYSGQKEVLKVMYASKVPGTINDFTSGANPFFAGILYTLKVAYEDRWDIQITELKSMADYELEGYDLYIFEHTMPTTMPKDGVVILADPWSAPDNSGIRVGTTSYINHSTPLAVAEQHQILNNVVAENITLSSYIPVTYYDPSYQVLLNCNSRPVLMVRNDERAKVVVMPFNIHYSNVAISKDFPILMYNIFEYFFPATVKGNSFEVNENVAVNARGDELYVTVGSEHLYTFNEFPTVMKVSMPGTYQLTQTTFSGKNVTESIYVKIPAKESNIWRLDETLKSPYAERKQEDFFKDLMVYVAAALVALLFIEWWLQSRETM